MKEHIDENPFTEDELARLTEQAGAAASDRAARPEQHYVAYGTTLLVAILTNEFLICFQLGDGDILAAYDATDEVGRVIAKDETLIANETTSLCQDDAVRQFRYEFRVIQHSLPGLVLLSTDGYANSFASPDAFLKVGRDYLDMLRTEGAAEVRRIFPRGWKRLPATEAATTSRWGSSTAATPLVSNTFRTLSGIAEGEARLDAHRYHSCRV